MALESNECKSLIRDVLLNLSGIKMYRVGKQEIISELPKKAKDPVINLKIELGMLCKKT